MSHSLDRAHTRHDLPATAPGEVKIYHAMAIRQLSGGGALIEIAVPLQIDSLHDFRLTLSDQSVVVQGRVVHSHISSVGSDRVTYRTGIEFVEPSEPVTHAIRAFIETIAQRAGQR